MRKEIGMVKQISAILMGILLMGGTLFTACAGGLESAVSAKSGDTVRVDYTGTLDDGEVFDSSVGKDPLEFTVGENQVIPGFEEAVIGMKIGESKTVKIPADEAYGAYREDMVLVVSRDKLPPGMNPQIGQWLELGQPGGQSIQVRVIDASESTVTLDANHPMAGKDLTFEIQLVEIVEVAESE